MKAKIHPKWHDDTIVTCTCGNSFETGSTHEKIEVEICSACHPFFTGEMKFVDTQGRVEKFVAKREAAQKVQSKRKTKAQKRAEEEKEAKEAPKTLKEMLMSEKERLSKEQASEKQTASQ